MAHAKKHNPVLAELDSIAMELEKTGNADLASYVDEVSYDLSHSKPRKASTKRKPNRRTKKNRTASTRRTTKRTNKVSRRSRIASAMRKIASAQVAELEDIASDLLKEGSKASALEVLKIAEDLDSEYCYSSEKKSSGMAADEYDRAKANKPNAKMDKEDLDDLLLPFGDDDGPGYPLSKESSFDEKLEDLIRTAMEGDPKEEEGEDPFAAMGEGDEEEGDLDDMDDMDDDDADDDDADDDDADDDDADDDDADDDDLDDMDEDEDDLDDMDEDEDDLDDMDDDEDDLDDMDDDEEGDPEDPFSDLDDEVDPDEDEKEAMDRSYMSEEEPDDVEGGGIGAAIGGALLNSIPGVGAAIGAADGFKESSVQRKKVMALARKISASGDKNLARRVAKLARKK